MKKNKLIIITIPVLFVLALIIFGLFFLIKEVTPKGTLILTTKPEITDVYIGEEIFKSPLEAELKTGLYDITIKADGYEEYVIEGTEIKENETKEIKNIFLQKKLSQEEQNFINLLPYSTINYEISYKIKEDGSPKYTISLFAILNGDNQLQQYKKDLIIFKKEALRWILSQSIDSETLEIEYVPSEATNL